MYDTKIAIVVLDSLLSWQKLNVVAFLSSAVAIKHPETHGEEFVDASNVHYLPFIRQPMLIFKADSKAQLKKLYQRGKDRDLGLGIYTEPLFATKGEGQNHEEIAKLPEDEQDYVGLVFYGHKNKVDKALKGLKLHP